MQVQRLITTDKSCNTHLRCVSPVCGSVMEPVGETGTLHGSSAWHATANHPECSKNYEWNPGDYAPRDRKVDYNLKCRVSVLRVHIRNSNKACDGTERCALKKFDIMSEQPPDWVFMGRFTMPDPGTTVKAQKVFSFISNDLQNCGSLSFETFDFNRDGNGIPYEMEMVAFVAGRHDVAGEAIDPHYHGNTAAVSQIIFETTVGELDLWIDPGMRRCCRFPGLSL